MQEPVHGLDSREAHCTDAFSLYSSVWQHIWAKANDVGVDNITVKWIPAHTSQIKAEEFGLARMATAGQCVGRRVGKKGRQPERGWSDRHTHAACSKIGVPYVAGSLPSRPCICSMPSSTTTSGPSGLPAVALSSRSHDDGHVANADFLTALTHSSRWARWYGAADAAIGRSTGSPNWQAHAMVELRAPGALPIDNVVSDWQRGSTQPRDSLYLRLNGPG